ncbi:YihY/virulence factor BrkB family protein [Curtobacterium flaccumfaciens]
MPDSASRDLQRTGVRAVVRRTYHSVIRHRVVDAAASLTFFALLTVFPTALAVVSALSIVDRKGDSLTDIVEVLGFIVRPETAEHLEGPLRQLLTLDNPWLGFTIGVALTLWSLSGYATAFGRAMNTAYEVEEGRRIWKFRSMMLLVTLLVMVGGAVAIVILLGTPTISEAVIRQLGWAPWIDDVWNVVKWPVLAADLVVMVAVLYYATPNVKTPQLRWVSAGAAFAIVTWAIATVGFALYVETLGGGNRAYGWLGGAILLLVYLYISNFVLVVGGEARLRGDPDAAAARRHRGGRVDPAAAAGRHAQLHARAVARPGHRGRAARPDRGRAGGRGRGRRVDPGRGAPAGDGAAGAGGRAAAALTVCARVRVVRPCRVRACARLPGVSAFVPRRPASPR